MFGKIYNGYLQFLYEKILKFIYLFYSIYYLALSRKKKNKN